MSGSENVPEPVGVFGQITAGLFGEMSGVVVEDDSDDAFGRIVRVQILLSREPTASAVSLQTERSRHSSAQAHSDSPAMEAPPFVRNSTGRPSPSAIRPAMSTYPTPTTTASAESLPMEPFPPSPARRLPSTFRGASPSIPINSTSRDWAANFSRTASFAW